MAPRWCPMRASMCSVRVNRYLWQACNYTHLPARAETWRRPDSLLAIVYAIGCALDVSVVILICFGWLLNNISAKVGQHHTRDNLVFYCPVKEVWRKRKVATDI
ncbi:unnamed protein product [Ixodes pacificus]